MKVGDKIIDEYLGKGVIVEDLTHVIRGAYMVKFEKTPAMQYNMGQNPTIAFADKMELREHSDDKSSN